MTPAPFRWAMRSNLAQIRHVTPVRPRAARGVVARVYAAAEREFGLLAPPIALHSPHPELLTASWVLLRETLLASGTVSRAEKEAVAAAVSLDNACPYCVEVHAAVLGGVHDRTDAAAIAADRIGDVADPALRAAATWARTAGGEIGGAGGVEPTTLPAEQAPELLGVLLAFNYLNRMVAVFLGSSPLPPGLPPAAAELAGGILGRVLRPTAERTVVSGIASDLPAAELPPDLSWAAPNPALAQALARVVAVVETAGKRVLAPSVRGVVFAELAARAGRRPQLGHDWTASVVSGLAPAQRSAARLALLTAVAPHQVDDAAIEAFRRDHRRHNPITRSATDSDADSYAASDAALVALTAWAGLTAARQATVRAARRARGEKTAA